MSLSFQQAIQRSQTAFGFDLPDAVVERLADYHSLVEEHNPLLHLVAPCSAEEFAVRHILESLTLLKHLPDGAKFADIGTGAGLPSLPCLIAREDLSAVLIESKEKKGAFLRTVLEACELSSRAEIVNRQFSEVPRPPIQAVTCRALDKFIAKLPQLLKWSGDQTKLFYGGPGMAEALTERGVEFTFELMPMSEQRYLFVIPGK